jgi:hypothetical protein
MRALHQRGWIKRKKLRNGKIVYRAFWRRLVDGQWKIESKTFGGKTLPEVRVELDKILAQVNSDNASDQQQEATALAQQVVTIGDIAETYLPAYLDKDHCLSSPPQEGRYVHIAREPPVRV